MAIPKDELIEKYECREGKVLYVCDLCGLLFCSRPILSPKIDGTDLVVHKCYACIEGGLE